MSTVSSDRRASGTAARPRLLIVATVPGTISSFLLPYARHFRQLGWEVDAATSCTDDGALGSSFDAVHDIPWSRSIRSWRNPTVALAAVRRTCRAAYDVVHVHTPIAGFVTRAGCRTITRRRRPSVIYTAHGFHFMPGHSGIPERVYQVAERAAGRWTDELVVINHADFDAARRLRIVPDGHLHLFPGIGVDLDRYARTGELLVAAGRVRQELGVPDGTPLLTMVAGLEPGKDHRTALRALAGCGRSDAHLALAGAGPTEEAVRREALRLGIGGRVHLLGHVDDVRPLVVASAATVLPSKREGLSRAVLESLALGVPVVGSDIRGIAELVVPGGGIVVPPGDRAGWAAAFAAVLDLPRPSEHAAALRQRLAEHSIGALIAMHEELYERVLVERARRTAADRGAARSRSASRTDQLIRTRRTDDVGMWR